ncbi:MAG: hypothetical protein LBQ79_05395 [Deltaproteobacteria bacterium]|jgi:hypothetical protein|nr:hypothetical protein [Deltaproteobacteria bacterium]
METAFAFRLEDVKLYLLCGGAIGLAAGIAIVMRLRRRGFFKRPSSFWSAIAKLEYAWTPLAFAGGMALLAGVYGMSRLTSDYIGSDRVNLAGSAAAGVDAALAEAADKIRGSGMGEEAFPEVARVVTDAASDAVYRAVGTEPAYSEVLAPARGKVNSLLRSFFSERVREAATVGAVSDASVLCEVARPRLRDAILKGEITAILREGSSGIFTHLYLYALASLLILLAPCIMENLCHVLFRTASPLIS